MKYFTPAAIVALLCSTVPGHGNIVGINAAASSATAKFDDTGSFDPSLNPGVMLLLNPVSPWNGSSVSIGPVTAPITFDTAQGGIVASFTALTYSLNVIGLSLAQPVLNSGVAIIQYNFNVQFQLDSGGLPFMATLAPSFAVNGTVQPGGFSYFDGSVQYASGALGPLEGVNYIYNNTTPGPYSTTVPGVPVTGSTPTLPANDTLTLSGTFVFRVDPASTQATSTTAAVPEPATSLLLLAVAPLFRRRRKV
jgi:hypothetical protein